VPLDTTCPLTTLSAYEVDIMTKRHLLTLTTMIAGSLLASTVPVVARAEVSEKEFNELMEKYLATEAGQDKVGKASKSFFIREQQNEQKRVVEQQQAQMEEYFKKPIQVDVGKSPVKGPASAKVTIVEFSDFQCPYCEKGKNIMDQVSKAYPNDVKIAFKNLPLAFHKEAKPAAKAALAAGKQGKFWEMHDALFDDQQNLGAAMYEQKAKDLGLDVAKFKADMNSAEIDAQIEDDTKLAEKLGIQGTPGFIVNGVPVKGAYPFEHFKQIIDRWLAQAPK
jgi:protein-disulfide isomerase